MSFFGDIGRGVQDAYASRYDPEGIRRLSDIYWRALLVSGFALLLFMLAYSVLDLRSILNSLSEATDTSKPPPAPLDRAELRDTLRAFGERRVHYNDIGASASQSVADPSR